MGRERISPVDAAYAIRNVGRRLLFLGAARGIPCRRYLCAIQSDCWRPAVSLPYRRPTASRAAENRRVSRPPPHPDHVRRDGVSHVVDVRPRLPRPRPNSEEAAYSGRSPFAPCATGSYRRGREVPVSPKRRPDPRDLRTDYRPDVFNSIMEPRY